MKIGFFSPCQQLQNHSMHLNYFERRFTLLSADAKHKEIENQMKAYMKMYDFDGLTPCIKKT